MLSKILTDHKIEVKIQGGIGEEHGTSHRYANYVDSSNAFIRDTVKSKEDCARIEWQEKSQKRYGGNKKDTRHVSFDGCAEFGLILSSVTDI